MRQLPDARLTVDGLVAFDDSTPLPSFSGTVYALLAGRSYILWAYPPDENGARHWDVINAGSEIVQTALDAFIKSHETA